MSWYYHSAQDSTAAKHCNRDTEQISTTAKRKKCDISDDNRFSNYVASQSECESGEDGECGSDSDESFAMTVPRILMIPLVSVKLTLLNLGVLTPWPVQIKVHGLYQKASQVLLIHIFVTSIWGIWRWKKLPWICTQEGG